MTQTRWAVSTSLKSYFMLLILSRSVIVLKKRADWTILKMFLLCSNEKITAHRVGKTCINNDNYDHFHCWGNNPFKRKLLPITGSFLTCPRGSFWPSICVRMRVCSLDVFKRVRIPSETLIGLRFLPLSLSSLHIPLSTQSFSPFCSLTLLLCFKIYSHL